MEIIIESIDKVDISEYVYNLKSDLEELHSNKFEAKINKKTVQDNDSSIIHKGNPELISLIVTMVGAGGFLSVAAAKGGLFTKIAEIILQHRNRKIQFKIKTKKRGTIELSGHADDVKKIIEDILYEETIK